MQPAAHLPSVSHTGYAVACTRGRRCLPRITSRCSQRLVLGVQASDCAVGRTAAARDIALSPGPGHPVGTAARRACGALTRQLRP